MKCLIKHTLYEYDMNAIWRDISLDITIAKCNVFLYNALQNATISVFM